MSNKEKNSPENSKKKLLPTPNKPNYQMWGVIILLAIVLGAMYFSKNSSSIEIDPNQFKQLYKNGDIKEIVLIRDQHIVEITLTHEALKKRNGGAETDNNGVLGLNHGPHHYFKIPSLEIFNEDFKKLQIETKDEYQLSYKTRDGSGITKFLMNWGFLILLLLGCWLIIRRMATGGGAGGQIFNIGKSKAALFDAQNKIKITFDNVAGLEEAKEEVKEVVEFLKSPSKYTKLGGKIPKGVLLIGAPGTGKTLLAKAVAGEAEVPFFSLSGSDFVEMFVGVGAARVRDLFKQAKAKAPCIIFIDEIDAIGRSRGKGALPGGNDERENTLNSLLVEMDGFGTDTGVIIMAATNRPDVLDTALLRPGRFDRQISIDKPDIVGREQIFKVHLKPLTLAEDVNSRELSASTPGFAGAEIANVCNEAALIAARMDKEAITMDDFHAAIDRVIGGLEKKNKIISPEEKRIVAYHEAGHAVVGWFLEHADPLVKVSIVPRGVAALGYAQYLPKEQFLYQTQQLLDEMGMSLGGRAAEEIVFNKISTGALSDLERITKMAYSMVAIYGMSSRIGNVSFYDSKQSEYNFNKPYSESTSQAIDEEVRVIIDQAYKRTKKLLMSKRNELEKVAQKLLEKEIIFQADLEELIGKRPFDKMTAYQTFTNNTENGSEKNDEQSDEQNSPPPKKEEPAEEENK